MMYLLNIRLLYLLVLAFGCIYSYETNTYNYWSSNRKIIPQDIMVEVVNSFGLNLLAKHNEGNDNNLALSPYGALSVLVALQEGLRSEAVYEIQKAANLPSDSSIIRIGLRDIQRRLKSYFIPEEGFLSGLSLSHENVTLNREYEELLKFYGYDVEAFNGALISTTSTPELTTIGTQTEEATTEVAISSTTNKAEIATTLREDVTSTAADSTTSKIEETTVSSIATTIAANEEIATTESIDKNEILKEDLNVAASSSVGTTEAEPTTVFVTEVPTTTGREEITTLKETTTSREEITTLKEELTTIKEELTTLKEETTTSLEVTETATTEAVATTNAATTDAIETTTNAVEVTTTEDKVPTTTTGSITTETEELTTTLLPTTTTTTEPSTTTPRYSRRRRARARIFRRPRTKRSIVDYLIARYYDEQSVTSQPSPYDTQKSFLINGKQKESNISYMTYDTVLPFCYIAHLRSLALKFPLDSPQYYLLLLLPEEIVGIDNLIDNLRSTTSLRFIIDSLRYTHVKALIPSFKLRGTVLLTSTLQKMGVKRVFEPRRADFSAMTKERDIYVTNIEQAITVTIRNYMESNKITDFKYLHQTVPVQFKADHPFLYFVMDSELHVALMEGKIINPLNSRIK